MQWIAAVRMTLRYVVDGETVWKFHGPLGVPLLVDVRPGETLVQATSRKRRQVGSNFGQIWIPAYIARVPADVAQALDDQE